MIRASFLIATAWALLGGTAEAQASDVQLESFWHWFQRHDSALFAVVTAREPICDTLAAQLQVVHPDLVFEFGPVHDGRREFVISADGLRDAFPAVRALGDAAPRMAHWKVTEFRPRREPMRLSMGGLTLEPSDVEVNLQTDASRIALVVSIVRFRQTPNHQYERLGYLILDQALGEYTMETRIGAIDFVPREHRPDGQYRSLKELPGIVDDWRN